MLRALLARGLDLTDPHCAGLLHLAAARGRVDLVDLLLAAGADPEARDADGRPCLECAVAQGQQGTAARLRRRRDASRLQ